MIREDAAGVLTFFGDLLSQFLGSGLDAADSNDTGPSVGVTIQDEHGASLLVVFQLHDEIAVRDESPRDQQDRKVSLDQLEVKQLGFIDSKLALCSHLIGHFGDRLHRPIDAELMASRQGAFIEEN